MSNRTSEDVFHSQQIHSDLQHFRNYTEVDKDYDPKHLVTQMPELARVSLIKCWFRTEDSEFKPLMLSIFFPVFHLTRISFHRLV